MPDGFRAVHKDDPMRIEFWSFGDEDEASRDIASKLAQRIETPVEWLGPEKLRALLAQLQSGLSDGDVVAAGLDGVLALLGSLDAEIRS